MSPLMLVTTFNHTTAWAARSDFSEPARLRSLTGAKRLPVDSHGPEDADRAEVELQGWIIASGRTIASNSSPLKYPSFIQASRRLLLSS